MRIIAGSAKGTKLKMVAGTHVRPTADRVKESLFQIIGPFFSGGRVLDLFAGTGALGLEALSRGMDQAVFVDQSAKSLAVIRHNCRQTRMSEQVRLIKGDALLTMRKLADQSPPFDLIFVDPPYHKQMGEAVCRQISEQALLAKEGKLVIECSKNEWLPTSIGTMKNEQIRHYGDTTIYIFCTSSL